MLIFFFLSLRTILLGYQSIITSIIKASIWVLILDTPFPKSKQSKMKQNRKQKIKKQTNKKKQ